MGQIKTGTSSVPESEHHHQVQAEYNPQSQAAILQHEPIYQAVQPAAPPGAVSGQFLSQTSPIQPVQFPPQDMETNVRIYSNDQPNQRVNLIYQQQGLPQAIYQQPLPYHPQNTSGYVSVSAQTFHEATYQVPPPYVVMPPPYIHGILSQFSAAPAVLAPVEGWSTGLFDCRDDPMNALITICFPCGTFGQVAEIVDEGLTSCGTSGLLYGLIAFLIGVPCILSCVYRTRLRHKFGLVESPAPDWVTHCFCDCCALCQEYRELQKRGWDPSLGWHGNIAMMQCQQ